MLYEISMILDWTKQRQNTALTDKFNRNSSLLLNPYNRHHEKHPHKIKVEGWVYTVKTAVPNHFTRKDEIKFKLKIKIAKLIHHR